MIIELCADTILLYIVNIYQCNLFTMCSFVDNLFTVTGSNTMHSKNRIGNRNFHSKLPISVFQINSISLIESEEFRETPECLIGRPSIYVLSFWITFLSCDLSVVFIVFDPVPYPINAINLATGNLQQGTWVFEMDSGEYLDLS